MTLMRLVKLHSISFGCAVMACGLVSEAFAQATYNMTRLDVGHESAFCSGFTDNRETLCSYPDPDNGVHNRAAIIGDNQQLASFVVAQSVDGPTEAVALNNNLQVVLNGFNASKVFIKNFEDALIQSFPTAIQFHPWGIAETGHVFGDMLPRGTDADVAGLFSPDGTLQPLWDGHGRATAMNSVGQVVGYQSAIGQNGPSGSNAMLWQDGVARVIFPATMENGTRVQAIPVAINNKGQVLIYVSRMIPGEGPPIPERRWAYLYSATDNTLQRLPGVSGFKLAQGSMSLNEQGQITMYFSKWLTRDGSRLRVRHFVFENGVRKNLKKLITNLDPQIRLHYDCPFMKINNNGEIIMCVGDTKDIYEQVYMVLRPN